MAILFSIDRNRKYGEYSVARILDDWRKVSSLLSNRFNDKISRLHASAPLRFFDRRSKRRRLETERATEGLIYALHTLLAGFHRKQGGLIFTATRRLSFSHNDSTSTVSHHPLMNKISLLPNLPCYLPSFDRKHPFLCTFSPLDHLDPVPTNQPLNSSSKLTGREIRETIRRCIIHRMMREESLSTHLYIYIPTLVIRESSTVNDAIDTSCRIRLDWSRKNTPVPTNRLAEIGFAALLDVKLEEFYLRSVVTVERYRNKFYRI